MSGRVDRWHVSRNGRQRMKVAARELRQRATRGESLLWNALRDRQMDGVKFRRQEDIGPFVVDFFAPSHRLVVEVDGTVHDEDGQSLRDKERQMLLESLGLKVLRVRTELVERDVATAIEQIRVAIRSVESSG